MKTKKKVIQPKDMRCDKCGKKKELLYSNNETLDFYCEKCYDELNKDKIREWKHTDLKLE